MENPNFWDVHGVVFLVCLAVFPRLTLLFSSVATGGFFWWLGWFFTPRLLVAILATLHYVDTNWILVLLSWLWAILFELGEKVTVTIPVKGK